MLKYLETWKESKSKIFKAEGFEVALSELLGDRVQAQYIEIKGNGLLSRATLWETGNLVLEGLDCCSEETVISEMFELSEVWQLEDKLNWWLSEIAIYEAL